VFGKIGQFLNLSLWYVMKNRCGVVGATGVAQAVRDLHSAAPSMRIHLVGHSLGGRLMAACVKTLAQDPVLHPDSLTLLEAAFSHYGLSANNGKGQAGFFRSVLAPAIVKGPFFATFSAQDNVVGKIYAIASRLAGDNVKEVGDAHDPYGGIGRNGAQSTDESISQRLLKANSGTYQFPIGKILCLDGSGGLITNHGDVTNSDVTFAFASALAQTGAGQLTQAAGAPAKA
jgi:esterase/lipase superfamily enzyme